MTNSKHLPPTLTFEEVERILQLQTSDVWSLQIVFIFCLPLVHRFGSLFSSVSYKIWFQDFNIVKIGFLPGVTVSLSMTFDLRETPTKRLRSNLMHRDDWALGVSSPWKEFCFAKLILQSQVNGLCSSWRNLITTAIRRRCQNILQKKY